MSVACGAATVAVVGASFLEGGWEGYQREGSLRGMFSGAAKEGFTSAAWAAGGYVIGRGLKAMYTAQHGDDYLKEGAFTFHLLNLEINGFATALQYGSTHGAFTSNRH